MSGKKRSYLGVDIGTTSLAAVIVDHGGAVLKTLSRPNPSACDISADGRHEQDADAILTSVNGLVAECGSFAEGAGMGCGLVCDGQA